MHGYTEDFLHKRKNEVKLVGAKFGSFDPLVLHYIP